MIRKSIAIIGLALVLVTAGCLGAPSTVSTGTPATGPDPATISVSGSGSVSVAPDLAVVSLVVETTDESADVARAQVADDVAAVRAALTDLGIEEDAVTTASYTIQPEYDYSNDRRDLLGYRAVHALTVEADVDEAGAVIDAAVGAGAVRVNGVQFTLDEETRQSAREQALGAAMTNAGADAEAIADAADVTIDGVRSVSTTRTDVRPYEAHDVAEAADGATSIAPGPVTVTADVQVVYRLG